MKKRTDLELAAEIAGMTDGAVNRGLKSLARLAHRSALEAEFGLWLRAEFPVLEQRVCHEYRILADSRVAV